MDNSKEFGNVRVELGEFDGQPTVKVYRLSTAKLLHHYRCRDEEQRARYVESLQEEEARREQAKADRAAKKKAARQSFVNPYSVGDLLYTSWGYDQTNVDFYQVVEVKPRSVKLCKVAEDVTATDWMSGTKTPRPNEFVGQPFTVVFQFDRHGAYLPGKYSSYSPWHGRPVHWSSYA
jgi:hypothetical protein